MKCGVGDYTAHLAAALAQAGATVAVLTDTRAASPVSPHLGVEVLPVVNGWQMSDAALIQRVVRQWQPDLVHIQYPGQGYAWRWLPWLLPTLLTTRGIRVIQTWHEYNLLVFRNLLNSQLPGPFIVVRPYYRENLSPLYQWLMRKQDFVFVPNAASIPAVQLTEAEAQRVRACFAPDKTVLVFFGFAYPAKGLELLFEIADPETHHLVLICDLESTDPYHHMILELAQSARWRSHVTITGFLPAAEVAQVVAAADAAVFPFREGGGRWNSSLHSAMAQGTFIVTTSREQRGYEAAENIYYAVPGAVSEMRQALARYSGAKVQARSFNAWTEIAKQHLRIYEKVITLRK
jgi:glycosyltransferase involved in cell wall biosynthesis